MQLYNHPSKGSNSNRDPHGHEYRDVCMLANTAAGLANFQSDRKLIVSNPTITNPFGNIMPSCLAYNTDNDAIYLLRKIVGP
jgi:hypothetical protein